MWPLDSTYITITTGFVFLGTVLDRAGRKVQAVRIVMTLRACNAVAVVQEKSTSECPQGLAVQCSFLTKGRCST